VAEPSAPGFGAPARRSAGRLGPIVALVLGVLALAVMTHAQALDRAGPPDPDPASPATTGPAGPPAYAFGSVTAAGAVVFALGEPVHAWAVDADGTSRWSRDLAAGDALACGPCPEAVLAHADGRVELVGPDGSLAPPPDVVAGGVVPARSLTGVVLAASRTGGAVEFLIPTSDGLVGAGSLSDARLDQPLVVVTPASRGRAVTVMRASSDPLRQAEFEVVHVTPAGASARTVELDGPGARPFPCAVADDATVAYLQQLTGPTADGSTHLVVRTDDGAGSEATVAGTFDTCAAGPDGAVLASAVTGADGDPAHTEVHLVWLGPSLEVRATTSEPVAGARAVVALDAPTRRVAVAGGRGPAVVLDGATRFEHRAAAAVAFDDRGGLWWVDGDARVTHEVAR